jgi:tripartite-type tricarboxylate transporter receptor subunit TctC
MITMKFLGQALATVLATVSAGAASAQAYPAKPVKVMVAFAAGGPIDLVARPVSQKLGEALGQSFIVDYKPGANGIIGSEFVAKSAPDGYTLLVFSPAHTINPSTQKSLPYDTLKDFAGVSPLARTDVVLVVNNNLPVKNVKELVALAKQRPGKLNFASSGTGGSLHLGGELLKVSAGIDMTHVPYKGASPALMDVVAGVADLAFIAAPPAVPIIKSGKVRLIAVSGRKRATTFPDTPTVEEQGFPKFEVTSGYGIVVPGATPQAAISRLNGALEKILASAEIHQIFAGMGLEPWYLKSEELQAWLREDTEKWQRVTRAIKYQPE